MEDQERSVRLTLERLRELFAKEEPDIEILSSDEAPGSGRGDNYTSMLYRLEVQGRNRRTSQPWSKSIIYKVLPESKERRELYKSELLFRNEVVFYTKVWPELAQLQADGRPVFNGVAKVYLAQHDLIAMEDLRPKGYKMADRVKGLQLDDLRHVLKALAGFHALSLSLKDLRPETYARLSRMDNSGSESGSESNEAVQEALFRMENKEWYRTYYRIATSNALKMLADGLAAARKDEVIAKFRAFVDEKRFFREMCELVSTQGPLSVFCHGDCWTNNFLFIDKDVPDAEVVCLVDFQLTRVGSLALDLAYVLYCSTSGDVRKAHMTSLLQHYHRHLMSALNALNPSCTRDPDHMWKLLNDEMRRCSRFGLGQALDMLPISTCTSDEAPDLYEDQNTDDEEKAEGGYRAPPPGNAQCTRLMTDLVLELVDSGVI
ncbi:hypothetical protein TKK_0017893 [Trichogramma kaykai]